MANLPANTQAKPYAPAVKANHLDQLKIGGDLEKKMFQIRKSIREMEKAYSSRGHLSDPIIHSYAETVAARMRGEIKSGIIKPVVSQVASIGFASLEQTLISYVTPELYAQAETEVRSGVAAGEELEEADKAEEENATAVPAPPMPSDEALEVVREDVKSVVADYMEKVEAISLMEPRSLEAAGESLLADIQRNPGLFFDSVKLSLAAAGELYDVGSQHVVYTIKELPSGTHVLATIGVVYDNTLGKLQKGIGEIASYSLTKEQADSVKSWYNKQPHGIKILAEDAGTVALTAGVGTVLKKTAGIVSKQGKVTKIAYKPLAEIETIPVGSMEKVSVKALNGIISETKLLWDTWENIEKFTVDGKLYAKVEGLLFTRHALEHTYPPSLGKALGHTSNHSHIGIAPKYIKMIMDSPETIKYTNIVDGTERIIYQSLDLRIVTENSIIITITKYKK